MSDVLPDPLVPQEVDLRDFQFTPIFRARLFGSSFHARSSDAEWRAGVTLWLKSWDQVPAGTLPDDDIDLCRLAELGRDMKTWKEIKRGALHGWTKCSDGLLHHAVVAQGVLEAWEKRSTAKKKGSTGAQVRWQKHRKAVAEALQIDSTSNASAIAQAMLGDSKGQGEGSKPPLPPSNGKAKKRGRQQSDNPGTTIPEGFLITEEMEAWALSKGLNLAQIDLETEAFIAWHKSQGSLYIDWDAAWHTRIIGQIKRGLPVSPPPAKPAADPAPEQPQLALRVA